MPLFRLFRAELFGGQGQAAPVSDIGDERGDWSVRLRLTEDQIGALVDLTQQVFNALERELKLTGFWESQPARNKLCAELLMLFVSPAFKDLPGILTKRDALISRVMEIAERNHDTILYAA